MTKYKVGDKLKHIPNENNVYVTILSINHRNYNVAIQNRHNGVLDDIWTNYLIIKKVDNSPEEWLLITPLYEALQ